MFGRAEVKVHSSSPAVEVFVVVVVVAAAAAVVVCEAEEPRLPRSVVGCAFGWVVGGGGVGWVD